MYGRGVNHNFHLYVPFEKYGNTHPEFYRFLYINGETVPTIDLTNGIADDGSLDESMPVSVAKIVVEELIKTADEHPDAEVLTFTQKMARIILIVRAIAGLRANTSAAASLFVFATRSCGVSTLFCERTEVEGRFG